MNVNMVIFGTTLIVLYLTGFILALSLYMMYMIKTRQIIRFKTVNDWLSFSVHLLYAFTSWYSVATMLHYLFSVDWIHDWSYYTELRAREKLIDFDGRE